MDMKKHFAKLQARTATQQANFKTMLTLFGNAMQHLLRTEL